MVVPLARVQSVRVVQGPLQRALGLATVHVDTAGGLHAVGRHRATADACALAALLSGAAPAPPAEPPLGPRDASETPARTRRHPDGPAKP